MRFSLKKRDHFLYTYVALSTYTTELKILTTKRNYKELRRGPTSWRGKGGKKDG
jgi:hypothetical protein